MAKAQLKLGIETGDASLKIALFDSKAKKVLRTDVVTLPGFPLDTPAVYENALSEWLQQNNVGKVESVSLAIPASRGVIRYVRIPSDVDNVEEYIRWEFSTVINTPVDGYYLDYELFPDRKKPLSATVAAFRRRWIDTLRDNLHKKDLKPGVVEPELFSLFNLLEVAEGTGESMQCVVKADRKGILAAWGNSHGPSVVRWCSTGALGVDPDADVYPQLADSLAQILRDGFAEHGEAKSMARVCGELSVESGFFDALVAKSQGIELVLWDSFLKLPLAADGNYPRTVLLCTGAIGAALRSAGDRK